MSKELISIIIPVYNAEKYIKRAIESLLNQTYKNIEIVCVNDGSKDRSLEILQEISKEDTRIKIINQNNQGVSVARNNGIKASLGEYIMFLDADDWYDITTCEKAMNKITLSNFDVVYFNYSEIKNKKVYKINNIKPLKNLEIFKIPQIVCRFTCAIYDKNFLIDNNILFPIGIKNHEDIIFSMKVFSHTKNFSTLFEYLYFYFKNEESTTHNFEQLNSQYALKYWLSTEEYKNQSDEEKLNSIDIFARFLFGFWSDIASVKYKKENENIIQNFLNEYENFKEYNLFNYVGYRRLRFKIIYKYLKKIKYFILNKIRGI